MPKLKQLQGLQTEASRSKTATVLVRQPCRSPTAGHAVDLMGYQFMCMGTGG